MLNLPSSEEPSRGRSVRWQHSAEINANAPHEDETQEGVGRLGHLLTAQERKAPPRGWGFVLEVWGGVESSHRNLFSATGGVRGRLRPPGNIFAYHSLRKWVRDFNVLVNILQAHDSHPQQS